MNPAPRRRMSQTMNSPATKVASYPLQQRGFSLIELLIGVVISLLGLAAVSAMMFTFSQKRNGITQTMSAQDNGVMALYRLERDIAHAGYGLMPLQVCTTINQGPNNFFPVTIVDGGSNSDALIVKFVDSTSGVPGTEMAKVGSTIIANNYNIPSSAGFLVDDYVVATALAPNCTVTKVTSIYTCAMPDAGTPTVYNHCTTCATRACAAPTNVPQFTSQTRPIEQVGFAETLTQTTNPGFLANLGPLGAGYTEHQYQVSSTLNAIEVAEYQLNTQSYANANRLVDDIVFLKAQYGITNGAAGSTTVAQWVSPASFVISAANVGSIVAIRLGVVARSPLRENQAIELNDTTQMQTVLPAISTIGSAVTYTPPAADAQHFRYRTYSTMVPLRAVIWK